jgi:hypothetical protein
LVYSTSLRIPIRIGRPVSSTLRDKKNGWIRTKTA